MLLNALNLSKSYSLQGQTPTTVLNGVNFTCKTNEFVAVMGPSGAGKSTLMHILASLDVPDTGTVQLTVGNHTFDYSSISKTTIAMLRSRYIGIVYQFHHLLPEFTARENVMMPLLISGMQISNAEIEADEMIKRVGLIERRHHHPSQLSGGEQQRIAIARALVHNPEVVFADEPTGNLDSANASAVIELITELQAERGLACIVATHSHELAACAHRIVRLQDGRITEQ